MCVYVSVRIGCVCLSIPRGAQAVHSSSRANVSNRCTDVEPTRDKEGTKDAVSWTAAGLRGATGDTLSRQA